MLAALASALAMAGAAPGEQRASMSVCACTVSKLCNATKGAGAAACAGCLADHKQALEVCAKEHKSLGGHRRARRGDGAGRLRLNESKGALSRYRQGTDTG